MGRETLLLLDSWREPFHPTLDTSTSNTSLPEEMLPDESLLILPSNGVLLAPAGGKE